MDHANALDAMFSLEEEQDDAAPALSAQAPPEAQVTFDDIFAGFTEAASGDDGDIFSAFTETVATAADDGAPAAEKAADVGPATTTEAHVALQPVSIVDVEAATQSAVESTAGAESATKVEPAAVVEQLAAVEPVAANEPEVAAAAATAGAEVHVAVAAALVTPAVAAVTPAVKEVTVASLTAPAAAAVSATAAATALAVSASPSPKSASGAVALGARGAVFLRPWDPRGIAGLSALLAEAPETGCGAVARLCAAHGSIPAELRGATWLRLVGACVSAASAAVEIGCAADEASAAAAAAVAVPGEGLPDAALAAVGATAQAAFDAVAAATGSRGGRLVGSGLSAEDAKSALSYAAARLELTSTEGGAPPPSALASLGGVLQAVLSLQGARSSSATSALAAFSLAAELGPLLYGVASRLLGTWLGHTSGSGAAVAAANAVTAAVSLHEQLRALVQYHDPALVADLDAARPLWHLPAAPLGSCTSPHAGCVPPQWLLSCFVGSTTTRGVEARALLSLLDRLLLGAELAAPVAALETGDPSGGDVTAALPELPSAIALRVGEAAGDTGAGPGSPLPAANLTLIALAATLLLRESVSLRALCGGSGAVIPLDGSAPAYRSGFESVSATHPDRVAGDESVAALLESTLESALRRFLSAAAGGGGSPGSASAGEAAAELGVAAWVDAAHELLLVTPASFWLGCVSHKPAPSSESADFAPALVAGPPAAAASTPPRVSPRAEADVAEPHGGSASEAPHNVASAITSSAALHDAAAACEGPTPRVDGFARISAAEVAQQAVFGYGRLAESFAAAGSAFAGDGIEPPLRLLPALLASGDAASLPPVHLLVVDCRPLQHRQAGRLATAFHVDPRTCRGPHDGGSDGEGGDDDDEAGALIDAGPAGLASPPGDHTRSGSGSGGLPNPGSATGLPLLEAVSRLAPLSGTLHLCVLGVGVRLIHRAYRQPLLAQCATADDRRVRIVVAALVAAGCRWVSVVDGGYAAVHDAIKSGSVLRLPSFCESSAAGAGGTGSAGGMMRKIAIVEHSPRRCPTCRHAALGKALSQQHLGEAPPGEPEGPRNGYAAAVAAAASMAQRNVAGALRSLQQHIQAPTVSSTAAAERRASVDAMAAGSTAQAFLGALSHQVASALAVPPPAPPVPPQLQRLRAGSAAVAPAPGAQEQVPAAADASAAAGSSSKLTGVLSAVRSAVLPPPSGPPLASAAAGAPKPQSSSSGALAALKGGLKSFLGSAPAAPGAPSAPLPAAPALPLDNGSGAQRARGGSNVSATGSSGGLTVAQALAASSVRPPPRSGAPPSTAGSRSAGFSVGQALDARGRRGSGATGGGGITVGQAMDAQGGIISKATAQSLGGFLKGAAKTLSTAYDAAATAVSAAAERAMVEAASLAAAVDDADASAAPEALASARLPAVVPSTPEQEAAGSALSRLVKGDVFDVNVWAPHTVIYSCTKEKPQQLAVATASEEASSGSPEPVLVPRFLCIAPATGELLVLAAHPTRLGFAVVRSARHVSQIAKLSFSRKRPRRITLTYRKALPAAPSPPAASLDASTPAQAPAEQLVVRVYHVDDGPEFKDVLQRASIRAAELSQLRATSRSTPLRLPPQQASVEEAVSPNPTMRSPRFSEPPVAPVPAPAALSPTAGGDATMPWQPAQHLHHIGSAEGLDTLAAASDAAATPASAVAAAAVALEEPTAPAAPAATPVTTAPAKTAGAPPEPSAQASAASVLAALEEALSDGGAAVAAPADGDATAATAPAAFAASAVAASTPGGGESSSEAAGTPPVVVAQAEPEADCAGSPGSGSVHATGSSKRGKKLPVWPPPSASKQ